MEAGFQILHKQNVQGAMIWPAINPNLGHRCMLEGFPGGSAGKESACNAGHMSSIPGLGRSPGEGKGYTL